MKVLVFAHTPPPVHGQSLMVRTLVEGLRGDPDVQVVHVNSRLSRTMADIGTWRIGKFFHLLALIARALRERVRHGPMWFYYVPAPGKRTALYRDWFVLLMCRPFFTGLVLHWHAVGLGEWLAQRAVAPERWATRLLLGRASLALVLAPELAEDARSLSPRHFAVVPNGVPDPGVTPRRRRSSSAPREVVFLGLGSRTKGLLDTLEAVVLADARDRGRFHLTVAGGFENATVERLYRIAAAKLSPGLVTHAGTIDDTCKHALLTEADVFCFPTYYPHEGQPLTILEALAHDLPIITTRWRAIPGMLPTTNVWYVEPGRPDQIAEALVAATNAAKPDGAMRRHFLARYTPEHHLVELKAALLSLQPGH